MSNPLEITFCKMIAPSDEIPLTGIVALFYLLFHDSLLFRVFLPRFLKFSQELGLVVFVFFR